jgi:hypothetical protein
MAWEIHPRNADLSRTLDPITVWDELEVVERYNAPGTFVVTGPASALSVITPGMGALLDRDGEQVMSGQVRTINRSFQYNEETGRPEDTITLGFIDDTAELWSRLCYPDPSHMISGTPGTFSASHDSRTGVHEALILQYVAANLGPAAPVESRRLASLVLPSSLGRGTTTTRSARMDVLGDLVAGLAEAAALRVQIVHAEPNPHLLLAITDVADLSDDVVFGDAAVARATGFVSSWGYEISNPQVTDVIAFSAGEQESREATRKSSTDARMLWGRRSEVLIDQRQTDDPDEITDALTERLEEGATPAAVSFTVAPGMGAEFRTDYRVGDRVGVELPGLPDLISDHTLREASTRVSPEGAEELTLVVGTPGAENAASNTYARRLNKALKRLAQLERSA